MKGILADNNIIGHVRILLDSIVLVNGVSDETRKHH